MLILAGVAVSVLTQDGGLFGKTKNSANLYERASENENKIVSNLMNYIDRYFEGNFSNNSSSSEEVTIDDELQRLLEEANMTLTLEDILGASAIIDNIVGLIPVLTEEDVTRSVDENGVITYVDSYGGVVRTNNETGTRYAWKAFDSDVTTLNNQAETAVEPGNYYVEYQFPYNVCALKTKAKITNGSNITGTRSFVIQGYNETTSSWENLMETETQTSTIASFPEISKKLEGAKSYKRYRLYINAASGSGVGGTNSGIYLFQLYGIKTDNLSKLTEEEKINKLLAGSDIKNITLDHMVTNTEFIEELIDKLSIETVMNNQKLREYLHVVTPTLTQNDVTRSVVDGVITYTDNKGGTVRTNSESGTTNRYAWNAFDGDTTYGTSAISAKGYANGYYIEYEFPQKMYATKVRLQVTIATTDYQGTRGLVIQGYNEDADIWEDVSEQITQTGGNIFPIITKELNYTKSYKRFRAYFNLVSGNGGYSSSYSGLIIFDLYGKKAD